MAQTIKLKRSATQGNIPTTAQLELGEVGLNTYDGKVFIKKNNGIESIVEITNSSNIEYSPTGNISSTTVQTAIDELDSEKQTNLVSGTNIKTINGNNILGSGNLVLNLGGLGGLGGFKNHIINGNFDKWDYGTSQTANGYGSDNRWGNYHHTSTNTHSRHSHDYNYFNARYFSKTTVKHVAGASNYVNKEQRIEDVTRLAGKTVTLSFWAKVDSNNSNIAIEFVQNFGTGGTPSATVYGIGSQLVALTSTWEKKTITVDIPSIVGKTVGTDGVHTSYLSVIFWVDAGADLNTRAANLGQQSGDFNIAQVQLEEGSIATNFEMRPIQQEIVLCERYFRKFYMEAVPSSFCGSAYVNNTYIGPMRVNPTISFTVDNGSGANYSTRYVNSNISVNQSAFNSVHAVATISLSSEL